MTRRRYKFWLSPTRKKDLDKFLKFSGWSFEQFVMYFSNPKISNFINKKELAEHIIRVRIVNASMKNKIKPIEAIKLKDKMSEFTSQFK